MSHHTLTKINALSSVHDVVAMLKCMVGIVSACSCISGKEQ